MNDKIEEPKVTDKEIKLITPPPLPFSPDDKIFCFSDDVTGEIIGEPYSYNDWIKQIEDLSGINEGLTGVFCGRQD